MTQLYPARKWYVLLTIFFSVRAIEGQFVCARTCVCVCVCSRVCVCARLMVCHCYGCGQTLSQEVFEYVILKRNDFGI